MTEIRAQICIYGREDMSSRSFQDVICTKCGYDWIALTDTESDYDCLECPHCGVAASVTVPTE